MFLDRVDRHQLLPGRAGGGVEPALAPGRAGADGPAGRLLHAAPALRLRRGARSCPPGSQEEIFLTALETSAGLAERFGPHPAYAETRAARGELHPDLWGAEPTQTDRWAALRDRIAAHGLRNSLLVAIAPTATIASIAGCYECIEPQVSNLFKRETMSGEFLQINTYLVRELKARGLWTAQIREQIKRAEGSVQGIADLPADVRELFRTAWELPQRALIDLAAARAPYIDQSQSLNLFLERADHRQALLDVPVRLEAGLKTTYYLRSRPATAHPAGHRRRRPGRSPAGDAEALACSLENPETCEACQ